MPTDGQDDQRSPANTTARVAERVARSGKLVSCPFLVLVDDEVHDQFYDVRDAMAAARALGDATPGSRVTVTDARTGKLVIEVGPV
jgi:hypothetical protein